MILYGIPALSGSLEEGDEALPAALCHCKGDRLLELVQSFRLLADMRIAEAQPSFKVNVARAVMHLVKHGFASIKLFGLAAVCRRRRRCETEAARRLSSHFNKGIETICIDAAIAVSICLREAVQEEAVELLVLHAVPAVTSRQDPTPEILLTEFHLTLRLAHVQTCCLLADVHIDAIKPMIEVDETCVLVINTCEKIRPSLRLLLRRAVALCNCWREAEASRHGCGSLN
mmetsp:Transcript_55995/g.102456  ORF Transcript_55995/g.102456 Transcript_55995/m.102456 type:complete len:230 (-) Transcript_55995:203-892(-)